MAAPYIAVANVHNPGGLGEPTGVQFPYHGRAGNPVVDFVPRGPFAQIRRVYSEVIKSGNPRCRNVPMGEWQHPILLSRTFTTPVAWGNQREYNSLTTEEPATLWWTLFRAVHLPKSGEYTLR